MRAVSAGAMATMTRSAVKVSRAVTTRNAIGSMVFDAKHRSAEKNAISEIGSHSLGDHLGAAVDAAVLRPAVVQDHRQQAAGRAQIVQDPEQ